MLGKLYKYDMKGIGRILLPLSVGITISSFFATVTLKFIVCFVNGELPEAIRGTVFVVMGAIFIGISVLALLAYPALSLYMAFMHYYRNFFTDEGYLTFTLPVRTSKLLLSKFLAVITTAATAACVTLLNLFMIVFFGTSPTEFFNIDVFVTDDLLAFFGNLDIDVVESLAYAFNGLSQGIFSIIVVFLSITVGSIMAKKHKIVSSIAAYYVITTVTSLVMSFFSSFLDFDVDSFDVAVVSMMSVNSVIYLGFAVAAYVVTHYLLTNKLNLQ